MICLLLAFAVPLLAMLLSLLVPRRRSLVRLGRAVRRRRYFCGKGGFFFAQASTPVMLYYGATRRTSRVATVARRLGCAVRDACRAPAFTPNQAPPLACAR